jgi:cell division transport system permease protein
MRANFVLSGVATGIRRNATMTIALVLSTSIALAFVGAAILANAEISQFRTTYEDKLNVSVYLCTTTAFDHQQTNNELAKREKRPLRTITCDKGKATTVAQTATVHDMLANDPAVKSVTYISQKKALGLSKKQQPTLANFVKLGDLPASFTVKLKDIKKDYPAFAAKYDLVLGVDQVSNQIATINTLLKMIDGARLFSIMIALVVLIASILLIANTIQVAAAQRKDETSIMRLVGASRWMTELPFMLETIAAAAVGGLIALGLIAVGKQFVLNSIFAGPVKTGVIPDLSTNMVLIAGGIGIMAGIVLAALTAFATLRLYVRL